MNIFEFIDHIRAYDYTTILFWWKIFAAVSSAALIAGIWYAVWRTQHVFAAYRRSAHGAAPETLKSASPKNIEHWGKIIKQGGSDDANERKFAVIAADSLIDKILERTGYHGENLGERLKKIEPSDLDSLHDIWEAHKVRNRIAHEANVVLSREEALRALGRYEKVLKELRYL